MNVRGTFIATARLMPRRMATRMHDQHPAHNSRPHATAMPATWTALLLLCAIMIGCAGPAIRSQSPEIEALASIEADTQLIGDYAAAWGLNPQRIERAALVTGLAGTGSDPPPTAQRQSLMADMQARGVVEPNALLASTSTSLVWARGYLPAGVRRGDRIDIYVEVPKDSETTSLTGGWLMETRLAEMAVLGSRIRDGHTLGVAEGPLLVDPVSTGTLDSMSKLRAKVPGGGVALQSRPIGLILAPEHRSISLSKRIGDCINRRFHTSIRGSKRGAATPKTDRYIELEIPPVYADNLGRYIRVVRCLAVIEPPGGRHARLELLRRQLSDPVTAPGAALRLEAIGKEAVPTLRDAIESKDAEIRFAAAEALAYLGESVAAPHLAEAATSLRSARAAALSALGTLDDANGIDALRLGTQESPFSPGQIPTGGRVTATSLDLSEERWRHERPKIPEMGGTPGKPMYRDVGDIVGSGIAVGNGVAYFTAVGSGKLVVLDAATGAVLKEFALGAVFAGPSLSRGRVYVGGGNTFWNANEFECFFPKQYTGSVRCYGLPDEASK